LFILYSFFPLHPYPSSVKQIFIIGLMAIYVSGIQAQNTKIQHDHSPIVRRMMDKFHCEPPKDDVLIQRILSNLVKALDPGAIYFTRPDLDTIYGSADMLKEELKGRETRFLSRVINMYKIRLIAADSSISFILRRPLDYSQKDYAYIRDTSTVASTIDLRNRWTNALKYDCLRQLGNITLADSSTFTPAVAMKQEPKIREKVCKSIERKIRRPLTYGTGFEAYVTESLDDAICKAYDPHSDYFTNSEKENFEGLVSGQGYLFGFDIEENDNEEVSISHLMPGSSAWRCGQLNKGDVIVSLRWAGQDPMDMLGADAGDVSRLLDDQNHKDLELGVRKADGTVKKVWLERQKIEVEDDFVKSYVLDGGDTRVGYIVLPGFYTESESKNGKSCANDVAREVVKLQKENIQSIILDLRNNGGGSMSEAMQLAGIFIDEGILAFAKYNTGKPQGFRDPNRGTIYDGPLIVMVNKASASASEMVAGALQDYNRALIVGSPTFGKATMQIVLPTDTSIEMDKYAESSYRNATEFVKITIGRFYRVTGGTHQLTGVQPDIHLPDLTESAGYGESHLRYPLQPDQVKRASYFNPLPPMPIGELFTKSNERVNNSDAFKMIGRYSDFIKRSLQASKSSIPLQYDEYLNFSKQYRTEARSLQKEYETIHKPGTYKTKNLVADADHVRMQHYIADELKNTIENIDKDIYIQECFSIITDYLKLTKK